MKALIYDAPETLGFRDAPDPVATGEDHLIRVEAVGICGSDMHAYLGHDDRRPAPLILGHEAAGVIVGGPRDGDRVTINPLVTCGTCAYCRSGRENLCPTRQIISMPPREGAFAQFVTMPERNLVAVPETVDLRLAALAEPLAVSWHAVRLGLETLHEAMPHTAVVLGGGAIGLAAALALRAMGMTDITLVEPNADRRAFLTKACDAKLVQSASDQVSVVVDAVGYAGTRATASGLAAPGGVVLHIGLAENTGGLDIRRMTLQEISFIGTYTYTAQDFRDCTQAMFDGRLGPLDWFETRGLSDGAGAFADLRKGAVASPKVILQPW
ncbi:MAG: alcohol dehydrogenase catalytic domain-containing protein [Pseudomonadota bacterium]